LPLQQQGIKAFSIAAFLWFGLSPGAREEPASATPDPIAPIELPSPKNVQKATGSCPDGMILVEGEYCPDADQTCATWMPDPVPYDKLRCAEYEKPAKCKGARQSRRFCIDRDEFTGSTEADAIPIVNKSWGEAKSLCEARGARLCKESEWEFACEGTEMSPYPYGWKRDSTLCNFDRTDLGGPMEKLIDHRAPISAFPACTSPFGVHDMVGNVDEWVERENIPAPYRSALRGGWWLPGRNRCRAATLYHDESYSAKQVGFRCCRDVP
jgi:hypothetical protein